MMNKKLLAILLLSASAVITVVESSNCPDAGTIAPCYCSDDDGESRATCSQITDPRQISKFVQGSDGVSYAEVVFKDFTIDAIPKEAVENVRVKSLVLRNLELGSLFNDIPKSSFFSNLTLEKVKLGRGSVSWEDFQYITSLENLFVINTPIPYLDSQFNQFVTHDLKYVEFRDTNTADVKKDAFKQFLKLDTVAFPSNNLKDLHRNAFPTPYNGKFFRVPYNDLRTLREDFLTNMPNLKFVDVSHNGIVTIPQPSEAGIYEKIESIDFSNNPIKCDCYLKWIPEIDNKQTFKGFCAAPKKLKGKPLSSLAHEDFNHCD